MTDDSEAEVLEEVKGSSCEDCDREWERSASYELGEQHAGTYDHRVRYYREVIFNGSVDE